MDYKKRKSLNSILTSWYGNEKRAAVEMTAFQKQPEAISSILDGILEKIAEKDTIALLEVKEKWEEIAGIQIAKISHPLSIDSGVIRVEVSHSIWLRELKGPTKDLIRDNINKYCGKMFCKDIVFVPQGSIL